MNYTEFCNKVIDRLPDYLSGTSNVNIALQHVDKINGTSYDGIIVTPTDSNVGVTLNLQDAYNHVSSGDIPIGTALGDIASTVETAIQDRKKIDGITDVSYIRKNAYLALANPTFDKNHFLDTVPHDTVPGTDLVAFPRVSNDKGCVYSVTNEFLGQAGMTGDEIMDIARRNTMEQQYSVRSMEDTLYEMLSVEDASIAREMFPYPDPPTMVILTTPDRCIDGASAMLHPPTLDRASEMLQSEKVVILPSSRHEVICVANNDLNAEGLQNMVSSINDSEVTDMDKLSDNVYLYDSESKTLTMADNQGQWIEPEHDSPAIDIDISHIRGR